MITIILLLFTYSKFLADQKSRTIQCNKYGCGQLPQGYCLSQGFPNNFFTSKCQPGSYCDLQSATCRLVIDKFTENSSYPGQKCSNRLPCKYGICQDQICIGKKQGEDCTQIQECNPGLRCYKHCLPLLKEGQRGCLLNSDCQSSACNFGQCTAYFSLLPGQKLEKCQNFQNFLCESSICHNEECLQKAVSDKFPMSCQRITDCESSVKGFYGSCECGYTQEGKAFCTAFPGDTVGEEYFQILEQ